MKVTVNDQTFRVRWRYKGKETECIMETSWTLEGKEMPIIVSASAFLSPKDRHVKNVGRKVSMNKVLMSHFPDQPDVRERFWTKYFQERGGRW